MSWFKYEEVRNPHLRPREEVISAIRAEGASVEDTAAVAVFISDSGEISYAVDGDDGLVFWDCGCYTPAPYDETCEAVAAVLEA